ncbi:peptidase inhibitor family I36 protein [Streptomyces clavuligerus]|uniref:Inhibitor_I36 domain-containing protein n=1 Tax=Streptomyces clavuligerus TaxID=1901 RepID=B5GTZ7_STRCL|nr:peptidase inhibitor family I36 protein [Streptomyces clavuligerus]ANW21384.1 hypothetical protein BB341_25835 [Streptomyces clavuligerus]AXU16016.1 hypothetical protein D1794_26850 [Streptomyces clavuligerus]EDY49793.1 hypothetical protein SSCG_02821 [Streptomyces clavuligerus]EFG05470.1 Inhibitor_I36 domain-containing protein [Streptomyces clavuligerus]MBY6306151.1 peptidase inhibitor family I36 protein [Streptomyces clavuligerus]
MPYELSKARETHEVRGTRRSGVGLRLAALATALTGALAAGFATAPQAAAGDPNNCLPLRFCLWEHHNFDGHMLASEQSMAYVGAAMNDKATSYRNRTNYYVTIYRDANYQGGCLMNSIPPSGISAGVPTALNDQISSFRLSEWPIC